MKRSTISKCSQQENIISCTNSKHTNIWYWCMGKHNRHNTTKETAKATRPHHELCESSTNGK